ncbi:Vacuolar inheritance and morphology protein [Coemansia javaensis]|uniref:Vacuolar inheritance and morphology protein n=1 Tax=Coemansia javaensis TaxID=2761396 RepID=A0A9W8LL03_9FUNG|nr:Vacuolar inheritance and morphology protein [Coemansia javaensis]
MGGDDDEPTHKTMIKQLTDLDDHALDEQAGLFMHPRRKSLRTETTPRPLSQPFFQPAQVFPDVLSVSAMVERQEQKDSKGQQQQQQQQQQRDSPDPAAQQQPQHTAPAAETGAAGPSSAVAAPSDKPAAQYPAEMAVRATQGGKGSEGPGVRVVDGRPKAGLRSVSLTRMAAERAEAGGASGGEGPRRDGAASADPYRARRAGAGAATGPGTPLETPAEEGDRQLGGSGEPGRSGRAGRRSGKRAAGGGAGSDGRGGRAAGRRANASSRGSEEENSDGDEKAVYRHSRSSLQVSSIPEEPGDDRSDHAAKRRANRHRLSTYMGEHRDSAGRGAGSATSAGSYAHPHARRVPGPGAPAAGSGGGGGGGGGPAYHPRQASTSAGAPMHPHRFSILAQAAANDYGPSSEESDIEAEPAGLRSTYGGNVYSRRNSRRQQAHIYYGSSEDLPETAPLFRRRAARRKRTSAAAQILRAVGAAAAALGALLVLVALFNLTSAPLDEVAAIRVSNILATEKELLFILHVQATNPNIREVLLERAEIGVFAAAAGGPPGGAAANGTGPVILLGNVYELSDPMRFAPGSLRAAKTDVKTTQISIHHPGGSLGGPDSERWRELLQGPYDLTVRGTLQYTLWQRNYAARICIAKLANLPPDGNSTAAHVAPVGMGCDDDDVITLPPPPTPPFAPS